MRHWPSAIYTSDRANDAALRDSMARFSAAATSSQRAIVNETIDEEEHMQARQYYEQTYWRAREQAHLALTELQNQRQREYDQTQAQLPQRRSTRIPNQHRVYLINCKSCGHFLTDRGMKAVLLLRPHITLYSTDAIPNCGPLYPADQVPVPSEPVLERTCNCLTQSLGCYGCGAAVGYHIVSPCSRCTNSVAKHQRSSNGHRTVLHCAEISVRERKYVPGEKGVMTATPVYASTSRSNTNQSFSWIQRGNSNDHFTRTEHTNADGDDQKETFLPYDDVPDTSFLNRHMFRAPPPAASTITPASSDGRIPRVMKRGDNVYWSDLVEGGERFEPIDSEEILAMPIAGR